MKSKFLTNLLLLTLVVVSAACKKMPNGDLWTTPAIPNADEPLTISFKAEPSTPMSGFTGDVYAHIGILEFGTWRCVQAEWTENKDKCKFTKDPDAVDTWHQGEGDMRWLRMDT